MYQQTIVVLVLCVLCVVGCLTPSRAAVSCTISATAVNFGNYDVFNATALASNGTLTVTCLGVPVAGTSVRISLNRGLHSPVFPNRNLANGAQLLGYNLYQDAGFTVIWGNGANGTSVYGPFLITNSNPVPLTMFGRVPAGQDVTAGSYTDTITATLTY
jgi:spore coat protein U-like protein